MAKGPKLNEAQKEQLVVLNKCTSSLKWDKHTIRPNKDVIIDGSFAIYSRSYSSDFFDVCVGSESKNQARLMVKYYVPATIEIIIFDLKSGSKVYSKFEDWS